MGGQQGPSPNRGQWEAVGHVGGLATCWNAAGRHALEDIDRSMAMMSCVAVR